MHRTLLIVSLLASGAAAAAHAQTVPASAPAAAPAAAASVQPRQHRLNSPLTVEQAEALMCPRWNCDAAAIDRSYRAVLAQRQAVPAQAQAQVQAAPAPAAATAMASATGSGHAM